MEKKIRIVSTLTGLAAIIIAVYIALYILSWLIPITITHPESWGEYYKENYSVNSEPMHRILLLAVWIVYIAYVCFVASIAFRICLQYRKGFYFSQKTYALIKRLGFGLMAVVIAY